MMRLIVDAVIAVMLVAILGGMLLRQRQERWMLDRVVAVQAAVRAIHSQAVYRAAIRDTQAFANGYSRHIDPSWFNPVPTNLLTEGKEYGWIDYAEENTDDRFDPECIVIGGTRGAFWYNGRRGTVRARVPMQMSSQAAVELYNLVNGTSLSVQDCRWMTDHDTAATVEATAQDKASPAKGDSVLADFGVPAK